MLQSALRVVVEVQSGDCVIRVLGLEKVDVSFVECADLDLDYWKELLTGLSKSWQSLGIDLFGIKEVPVDLFSYFDLLRTLLVCLDSIG